MKRAPVSNKEVVAAFTARAERVLNSRIIDSAKARLANGFDMSITQHEQSFSLAAHNLPSEDELKLLALDLRPFFPWVEDVTSANRVLNVLIRSTTDAQWKARVTQLKGQINQARESFLFKNGWSKPSDNWQEFITDRELAHKVINSIYFHEGTDPRWREILLREHQQASNIQAVTNLINKTIMEVAAIHKLIVDMDDAGVLNPKN